MLFRSRIQDRDTPTGKAMHIEEIQSDWHQAGRKQGYATKLSSMPEISADDLYNKYYDQLDQYQKHYLLSFMKAWESAEYNGKDEELNSLTKQYQDWTKSQSINNGIPDAPFKKNWHEMVVNALLHRAAEEGHDHILITPGAEQADRYDLSKHVDSMSYHPDDKGRGMFLNIFGKNGEVVYSKLTPEDKLDEVIGKDVANKLLAQKPVDDNRVLTGLDLKVEIGRAHV